MVRWESVDQSRDMRFRSSSGIAELRVQVGDFRHRTLQAPDATTLGYTTAGLICEGALNSGDSDRAGSNFHG